MSEIDSAAFEAGEASCNFSQDNLSASGSSTAAHFSDPLGRVYVTARARLLSARPQAGHTQPALTLVVEDSANGSSWATVATFDFTASDQQSAAVDSPRAYLRASWTDVVGTWAVDVAVKSIATPASGGGSVPTVIGPFTVNFDDPADETLGTAFAFSLADLPGGTVVLRAWGFVKIPFLDAGGGTPNGIAMNAVISAPGEIISNSWTLGDYDPDQRGADYTGAGNGSEEPSGNIWPLVGWTSAPGVLGLLFSPGLIAQDDLVSGQAVCGALIWTP